jgi:Tfp pilus assembly protein PilO
MNNFGNVSRYLKYLEQSNFFYFYILLFCFFVFGVGGILPLSLNFFKKVAAINEMNILISNFEKKEEDRKLFASQYQDVSPYLYYLDLYMPEDINSEDYLTSLNAVVSNKGFSIRRFIPKGGVSNNTLDININIDGYGDLPELVKEIEALKRVTKINSLEINKIKGRERFDLGLQIFSR